MASKPQQPRDTNKYHLKQGRRTVHTGITNNLERREREHQQKFPGSKIHKVGRVTTREGAQKWEREQRNKGKPTGP